MRAPEPRGQKSVDARESAKRLAARNLNTPDLFAARVNQSATPTHLNLAIFRHHESGQENSALDTGLLLFVTDEPPPASRCRKRRCAMSSGPRCVDPRRTCAVDSR